MTGLEEFANRIALKAIMGEQDGFVGIVVDDFIAKLEEYMVLPELARVTGDDLYRMYLQGYDFATAKMLRFLKSENVK